MVSEKETFRHRGYDPATVNYARFAYLKPQAGNERRPFCFEERDSTGLVMRSFRTSGEALTEEQRTILTGRPGKWLAL